MVKIAVHLAVAGDVFDDVILCCPFFPRDGLDENWDLIDSVCKSFPIFPCISMLLRSSSYASSLKRLKTKTKRTDQKCLWVGAVSFTIWFAFNIAILVAGNARILVLTNQFSSLNYVQFKTF